MNDHIKEALEQRLGYVQGEASRENDDAKRFEEQSRRASERQAVWEEEVKSIKDFLATA